VEDIIEGIVSLGTVPSSKNLESVKYDSAFVNGLTSPLIFLLGTKIMLKALIERRSYYSMLMEPRAPK